MQAVNTHFCGQMRCDSAGQSKIRPRIWSFFNRAAPDFSSLSIAVLADLRDTTTALLRISCTCLLVSFERLLAFSFNAKDSSFSGPLADLASVSCCFIPSTCFSGRRERSDVFLCGPASCADFSQLVANAADSINLIAKPLHQTGLGILEVFRL